MTDLILLHPPCVYDFRKSSIFFGPISDVIPSTPVFEMYPLGFVSLSSYLNQYGYDVRIVNVASKMLSNLKYDPEKEIKNLKAKAFGIDLHWLPHAQGSLELAKIVKKYHPQTPVIFGGLSSTYFHQELIKYPQVDFVIRGESAEVPLLNLLSALQNGNGLSSVPNLTYKKNGKITTNLITYVPEDLNEFSIDYAHIIRSVIKHRDLSGYLPFSDWEKYPITAVFTCRGCTYHCRTCGGSFEAYQKFCHRRKPAYRDPKLVASDINRISKYFKGPIFVIGDIFQPGEEYAQTLLDLLKKQRVDNHLVLEFFDIPNHESLKSIASSIPHFNIQLSPESHDQKVRAGFGRPYDNEKMEGMIGSALEFGCQRLDLFFMIGLSHQNYQSVLDTVEYCDHLLERFGKGKRLHSYIAPLAPFVDPGSCVFENPEKFGYKLFYRTLEEHRRALLSPSWKHMLNYETVWMNRDEIVQSTYQSALRLNEIKYKHGLISFKKFKQIERGIKEAIRVIGKIDNMVSMSNHEIIANEGDCKEELKLNDPKKQTDRLKTSTLCDKNELKWPVRFFKFNVTKKSFRLLAFRFASLTTGLRIKNILWLILRGRKSQKTRMNL
ncbi:MAG: TIGR04190 family B12-binding domain/radical SAM domain protein [candidate division Zixibacteria bacterium]|nr:TIGR04190 family B12-binding domain/radical SAM domain protein [candidate division Zixibacteria bacterium]